MQALRMQRGMRSAHAGLPDAAAQPARLLPLHHRAKLMEELKVMERAKNDMQVEETFVYDKYKQVKAENERLQAEIGKYRTRLGNATEDYVSGRAGAAGGQRARCALGRMCARASAAHAASRMHARAHASGCSTAAQADILEHRQEQIKAEEVKLRSMQAQVGGQSVHPLPVYARAHAPAQTRHHRRVAVLASSALHAGGGTPACCPPARTRCSRTG